MRAHPASRRRRVALPLALFAVLNGSAPPPARALPTDTFLRVVASGDPAPGGGGTFVSFSQPVLHGGHVTFRAETVLEGGGLWDAAPGSGGGPHLIADLSTAVPDGNGGTFSQFGELTGIMTPEYSVAFGGIGSQGEFGLYFARIDLLPAVTAVVDHNTAIPPNDSHFLAFDSPALLGAGLAFLGTGSASIDTGLYVAGVEPPPPLQGQGALLRLVDLTTPVPGGNGGTFTELSLLTGIMGPEDSVAFAGLGSQGEIGVYHVRLGQPGVISVLADQNTPLPGSNDSLSSILALDLDVGQAVLQALAMIDKNSGIYAAGVEPPPPLGTGAPAGASLRRIADKTTPVPGGLGSFADFGAVTAAAGRIAFVGEDGQGGRGIYSEIGGVLRRVIAAGDALDGKTVADVEITDEGSDGPDLAFRVLFADQSETIYRTDLTVVFADGFESGDLSAWSGSVP